jgi:hypothetical protein
MTSDQQMLRLSPSSKPTTDQDRVDSLEQRSVPGCIPNRKRCQNAFNYMVFLTNTDQPAGLVNWTRKRNFRIAPFSVAEAT